MSGWKASSGLKGNAVDGMEKIYGIRDGKKRVQ